MIGDLRIAGSEELIRHSRKMRPKQAASKLSLTVAVTNRKQFDDNRQLFEKASIGTREGDGNRLAR
jgi:hypothetical protein